MMKVRQKYGDDTTNEDLMKIPLEGLHSIALQQIGEQESYIEELEDRIRSLKEDLARKLKKEQLTKEENKRIAQEVRRDRVIEKIYSDSKKHKAENKRLRTINRDLVVMLCQKDIEIASLKKQLNEVL